MLSKRWKMLRFESLVPGQPENPMVEKEIGPEGGVVELENVARLEIPLGALDQPTLIKIFQVLEVESTQERLSLALHSNIGSVRPGFDFITPVVRLEPFGLKLNVAALLYLPTDEDRIGINNPALIKHLASLTAKNGEWVYEPYLDFLDPSELPHQAMIQDPIKVRQLVYISKQFSCLLRPDERAGVSYSEVKIHPTGQVQVKPSCKQKHRRVLQNLESEATAPSHVNVVPAPKKHNNQVSPIQNRGRKMLKFVSQVPGQPECPMVEKEISPEGGIVELENVARLEIPPAALDQPTLIKIFQVLQVESNQELDESRALHSSSGKGQPGFDFITPIVRLEPFGLKLKAAALLYLPTDAVRVGNNDPKFIRAVASWTAQNGTWSIRPYLEYLGASDVPSPLSSQAPIKVCNLVYVAKQISVLLRPN